MGSAPLRTRTGPELSIVFDDDVPARRLPTLGALPAPSRLIRPTTGALASCLRLTLLVCVMVLGLVTGVGSETVGYLATVVALGVVGSLLRDGSRAQRVVLFAEPVVIAVGVVATAPDGLLLLACLPWSLLAAGLAGGYAGVVWSTAAAGLVLLGGAVLTERSPDLSKSLTQMWAVWLVVALSVGWLAARMGSENAVVPQDHEARYAEAYRLLAQLRSVARHLPGSLDPGSVARTLLEKCVAEVRSEHGAVLVEVGGDQLVPLALHGYQRVPWRASLDDDGPIARAWLARSTVLDRRGSDRDGSNGGRRGSVLLVVPMIVEDHFLGVVALETRRASGFTAAQVQALNTLVAEYELPLETATLFDELRMGAANEERARLAREMHDGIAQDLASLGYALDAVTATLRRGVPDDAMTLTVGLRRRITELIGELRLSMTDLRSSVGPGRGLGAALSEYARAVGTSTGMTVHLSLTEGSTRLPADTEVQLLRIAHEAILRARRRVATANLWVSLTVDPPMALLVIEDDAADAGGSPDDKVSLKVMQERARSLGAVLTAEPRTPRGTRLSVSVGGIET